MMVTMNIYFGTVPGIGLITLFASFIQHLSFSRHLLSPYSVLGVYS